MGSDGKAHDLIGRKLCSRRTGSVQYDGFGGLAHGDGRSGKEQTQRGGVNMNSAQHGGLLLRPCRTSRPTHAVEIGAEFSGWEPLPIVRREFAKGRVPRGIEPGA